MADRQLHLGAILEGIGTDQNGWRDPALPGDASIDIDWYRQRFRTAYTHDTLRGHLGLPIPANRHDALAVAAE